MKIYNTIQFTEERFTTGYVKNGFTDGLQCNHLWITKNGFTNIYSMTVYLWMVLQRFTVYTRIVLHTIQYSVI